MHFVSVSLRTVMYMFFTLGLFWTLIYIIFRFKNIILNVSVQFIIKSERTLSVNCVNTYEKYVFDLKTSYNLIFMFDIIDSIFDGGHFCIFSMRFSSITKNKRTTKSFIQLDLTNLSNFRPLQYTEG